MQQSITSACGIANENDEMAGKRGDGHHYRQQSDRRRESGVVSVDMIAHSYGTAVANRLLRALCANQQHHMSVGNTSTRHLSVGFLCLLDPIVLGGASTGLIAILNGSGPDISFAFCANRAGVTSKEILDYDPRGCGAGCRPLGGLAGAYPASPQRVGVAQTQSGMSGDRKGEGLGKEHACEVTEDGGGGSDGKGNGARGRQSVRAGRTALYGTTVYLSEGDLMVDIPLALDLLRRHIPDARSVCTALHRVSIHSALRY